MYYPTVPGPAGKSAGADWDGWAWIGQPARRRLQEAGAPAGYGSYGGTITGTCTAVLAGARPPMSSARQDRASCKSESEGNSRRRGFAQSQASQRHHPGRFKPVPHLSHVTHLCQGARLLPAAPRGRRGIKRTRRTHLRTRRTHLIGRYTS
jgi:hypothetical protein